MSSAFSPIMIDGALVLPDVSVGMIEPSATRRPANASGVSRSFSGVRSRGCRPIAVAPPVGRRSYAGNVLQRRGFPGGIVEDAFWRGQAVMLAQHRSLVFSAEQPPLLEDRDHLGAKHVKLRRQQWRHNIEPVGRTVLEPVLDKIGDLVGGAGGDVMPARAGKISEQLAQCRLVAPHQTDDDFGAAARGLYQTRVREIFRDKRAVERQVRKIVPAEAA